MHRTPQTHQRRLIHANTCKVFGVNNVLRDAARRYFDRKAYAQFKLAKITAGPTGGTSTTACTFETTGASTVTNNVELGTGHVDVPLGLAPTGRVDSPRSGRVQDPRLPSSS